MPHVLVWGREGNYGPNYPRNRVVFSALRALGCQVSLFRPVLSAAADLEYSLRRHPVPDVVWVPCFRQRDMRAAARYARRKGIPLIFDPLISAWDKQVNERSKFSVDSVRSRRLLAWERKVFAEADSIIADTTGHADFFHEHLKVPRHKLVVVPVGAEEALFSYRPFVARPEGEPLEAVFFGTFIGLQGVDHLIEAIGLYLAEAPPAAVKFRLLGDGPLRPACAARVAELALRFSDADIAFEDWRPLGELPARLGMADFFLGIFGTSDKASRVIPNKVYQALAIGRPVITASTPAYDPLLRTDDSRGFVWCRAGDPVDIARAIRTMVVHRADLLRMSAAARKTYDTCYSQAVVQVAIEQVLQRVGCRGRSSDTEVRLE